MAFLPQNGGGLFTIDPNATPEQLARKRELLAAMMPQFGNARYVGQGVGQLATGIAMGRQRRQMDKIEGANRDKITGMFDRLFSGGGRSTPPFVASGVPASGSITSAPLKDPNSPEGIAGDAMVALGKSPDQVIKAGLMQRGLPEHVADGFIMNFRDESGLNPDINEKSPLVPGSRGGYGLAQWTGPRRRALEKFAVDTNRSVSDPNLQLDFLMTELQGPESKAAASIMNAPDASSAAQAIAKDFLRPAPANLDRRMSQYGGGAETPAGSSMDLKTLAEIAASPYASPGQRAMAEALLKQQMQAMDPNYSLDLELKRAELERMRSGGGDPELVRQREELARRGGLTPGSPEYQQFILTGNTVGRGANEYGLTPLFGTDEDGNITVMQLGKDGTAVTTSLPEGVTPNLGLRKEEEARGSAVGKASGEATAALDGARVTADRTLRLVDDLYNDPYLDSMVGPVQGRMPNVSAKAGRVQAKLDQLQGTAFLEAYNMLRGGGQITEVEGKKAEDAMARLKVAQNEEDFRAALMDFRDAVQTGIRKLEAASGATAFKPQQSGDDLSAEERAFLGLE